MEKKETKEFNMMTCNKKQQYKTLNDVIFWWLDLHVFGKKKSWMYVCSNFHWHRFHIKWQNKYFEHSWCARALRNAAEKRWSDGSEWNRSVQPVEKKRPTDNWEREALPWNEMDERYRKREKHHQRAVQVRERLTIRTFCYLTAARQIGRIQ